MKTIGVYGSLKKGCYNHKRWGLDNANYLGTTNITGAMDLAAGGYPRLFEIGDAPSEYERVHNLEIYEVEDDVYDAILSMEVGAGYEDTINNNHFVDEMEPNLEIHVFKISPQFTFNPDRFLESYDNTI